MSNRKRKPTNWQDVLRVRPTKPVDWPAVISRSVRRGHNLRFIELDFEEWDRAIGGDARMVVDFEDDTVWVSPYATAPEYEQALRVLDYTEYHMLQRPESGLAELGKRRDPQLRRSQMNEATAE